MNSPQQIQLNETFSVESIMERAVADVKSITGGWIKMRLRIGACADGIFHWKNGKFSWASSCACTNGIDPESGILLCILFSLR
jgi:hypothetical protein